MKPTLNILVCVLAAGSAFGQSPSIIQNTRNTMNAVSDKNTAASNEALGIQSSNANSTHSAPVKASPVAASAISSKSIAPKSTSPKKTEAMRDAPKVVAVKTTVAKTVAISPMSPKTAAKTGAKTAAKTADKTKVVAVKAPVVAVQSKAKPRAGAVALTTTPVATVNKPSAKVEAPKGVSAAASAVEDRESEASLPLDSKYGANGRRDPFISPVVSHNSGATACTSGKKCLEIGTINLRGVVHGENGFIAVVSNNLNKAYFLRENDPVFNGYVVKITGDSIVFQETLQDRLGKSFTREITKKIITPAV